VVTNVPLGRGAYRRNYTGAPEVQLLNRWVEANPANPTERVSLIARPGTTHIGTFNQGGWSGYGPMRGNYALSGLFHDSLFVVCGDTLYRIREDGTVATITGVISGTGYPEVAWQRGEGYERLWISDGLLLQYYGGTTHAKGTLTVVGPVVAGTDIVNVAGVYYKFDTSFNPTDDGSSGNPFIVDPKSDPLYQLTLAINNTGTPGVDYSSTIGGPNTYVGSLNDDNNPVIEITLTARTNTTAGNSLPLVVVAGTGLQASGSTLTGGGIDALQGVTVPEGQVPRSLSQIDSYVLVSINDSQKFYWVKPGEVTIDPLDFAAKEGSPDPIMHIRTVGDQVLLIGEKSTENWYATGNELAPFTPIEGRAYARGAITGTPVVVDESVFLVGDDGKVYQVGLQGINAVSNNGIEERIRRQVRREQGLNP
jgi:hypothetical protein